MLTGAFFPLADFEQRIAADPDVLGMLYTGSTGRGDGDRYSDLDIKLWVSDDVIDRPGLLEHYMGWFGELHFVMSFGLFGSALFGPDWHSLDLAVREAGIKTVCGFVLRYNPMVVTAKAMIRDGMFGELLYIQTDYWHNPVHSGYPAHPDASAMMLGGCHALDMARFKVRSNCVSPFAWSRLIGTIPTDTPEQKERVERIQNTMTAAKIAPICVFLASDLSKDVTGQIFAVRKDEIFLMSQPRPLRVAHKDGGWTPQALAETMTPAFKRDFYPLEVSADVFNWEPL